MTSIELLNIQSLPDSLYELYIHSKHSICLFTDKVEANGNPIVLVKIGQQLIHFLVIWTLLLHDLVHLCLQIFFDKLYHPCVEG